MQEGEDGGDLRGGCGAWASGHGGAVVQLLLMGVKGRAREVDEV